MALYNRSWDRIAPFRDRGYVELEGEYEGIGELSYIGTDLARALADRDVIMIVTTATGHRPLAERMAPHLRDGQIILLNPGRTFGALEVWHVLRERGCTADVIVGEADTLVYVSRVTVPGTAIIKAVKREVSVSAVRADDTPFLLERLRGAYPQFVPAPSFLGKVVDIVPLFVMPSSRPALSRRRRLCHRRSGVLAFLGGLEEGLDGLLQFGESAFDLLEVVVGGEGQR